MAVSKRAWAGFGAGVVLAAVAVAAVAGGGPGSPAAGAPVVTVYKNPSCGCCSAWVEHLEANGFDVKVVAMEDPAELSRLKAEHGVPPALAACHTALVEGYVIEGHVPADLIRQVLRDRPDIAGLAVPGMPAGSPGMEGPRKEAYDVLTFDRSGRTTVYAHR